MTKILVIPDAHAHPDHDHDRFEWLGKFILDERPDEIVCIGDFADMPSLSSYDRGTKGFEGRRYWRDVQAAIEAQERLFGPIKKYNKHRGKTKHKKYKPKWVMTLGNHEDRINRVTNSSPELDGAIGIKDLEYRDFGWEVVPFKEHYTTQGIMFSHYFGSGVMGRPISGEHIAASLCKKLHASAVQGHSHVFDHAERTRPDGTKIFGLSVGCYTTPRMVEEWSRNTAYMWWRGVVILNDCDGEGYYDELRAITMRKLRREYG